MTQLRNTLRIPPSVLVKVEKIDRSTTICKVDPEDAPGQRLNEAQGTRINNALGN